MAKRTAYEVRRMFGAEVDGERIGVTNDNVDEVFPKLTKKDQKHHVDSGAVRVIDPGADDEERGPAAKSNEPEKADKKK